MSKFSIANLMSPPEVKPLDTFSITPTKSPSTSQAEAYTPCGQLASMADCPTSDTKMRVLPSPPTSPQVLINKRYKEKKEGYKATTSVTPQGGNVKDPVLYPESESFSSTSEEPLFPSTPSTAQADEIISKHKARRDMHMAQFNNKLNRPTDEEYRLAISVVSQVGKLYNQDPRGYLKRQHDENNEMYYQTKRLCARPGTTPKKSLPTLAPLPKPSKRAIARATPVKPAVVRVKRTPKPSPRAKLMGFPDKGRSETPDRQPGAKREDIDYNSLPDYAPPTSTLPEGNAKALKADWQSNNVLNLSNDPDRHMLHEAEINLAGTLRLNCATYMCSKRRIFHARLNALKIGKEFRKTDAQQACKIDVNKASKLWTAYDKVGWFNKSYFQQYL